MSESEHVRLTAKSGLLTEHHWWRYGKHKSKQIQRRETHSMVLWIICWVDRVWIMDHELHVLCLSLSLWLHYMPQPSAFCMPTQSWLPNTTVASSAFVRIHATYLKTKVYIYIIIYDYICMYACVCTIMGFDDKLEQWYINQYQSLH